MPTATLTTDLADEIIAGWRSGTILEGWDNPAGPLFPAGKYAEHEITMTGGGTTRCSSCTGSRTIECC